MATATRHVDLTTATKSAATIRKMIGDHRRICRDCYETRPRAARYCETGWNLVKQLAVTEDDIRRLSAPDLGPPPTLF
jgi:hypothetical protein